MHSDLEVIPYCAAGLSYAEQMTGGKRILPHRMFSHNWRNLFAHLMAAVFSEFLQIRDYCEVVAHLRPDRIDLLEAMCTDAGVMDEGKKSQ